MKYVTKYVAGRLMFSHLSISLLLLKGSPYPPIVSLYLLAEPVGLFVVTNICSLSPPLIFVLEHFIDSVPY